MSALCINGKPVALESIERKGREIRFTLNGHSYTFRSGRLTDGSFVLEQETAPGLWQRTTGTLWGSKGTWHVQMGMCEGKISQIQAGRSKSQSTGALSPLAPMPGLIRQVLVKKGAKVKRGDALIVMEAMKLQTTLAAGGDGIVEAILIKEGEMVAEGAELVRIKAGK